MNILIVGNELRHIHLKEFSDELKKHQINSKVIIDTEFIEKSLSLDLKSRIEFKKKREEVLHNFKPDLVVLDRISKLGEFFLDKKIPLFLLLRGNYWEELEWMKKTNVGSKIKSLSIYKNQKIANRIFRESKVIIAIVAVGYLMEPLVVLFSIKEDIVGSCPTIQIELYLFFCFPMREIIVLCEAK